MMVGHFYENRQDVVAGVSMNEVPMASQNLLQRYKVF
jgi:hypothetical protein